jgi:hypothetical protein
MPDLRKLAFSHEIGHCTGLADNQPLISRNLMLSGGVGTGMLSGMDVNTQFDQNTKLDDGSQDWND